MGINSSADLGLKARGGCFMQPPPSCLNLAFRTKRKIPGFGAHRTTQVIGTILNDSICVRNSGLDFLLEVVTIADCGE